MFSTISNIFSITTEFISGFNEWVGFFQWLHPGNTVESTQCHEELWKLQTTLPLMQVMIDTAEWSFHKEGVPEVLQELKGLAYDTEDLIKEFEYLKLKSEIEDGAESLDFSKSDILCSFSKLKILQQRAEHLMGQMNTMVPQNAAPHFDRSVRTETSSVPESKVFGRHKEVKAVKGLLGVPLVVHSGAKRKKGQTLTAVSFAQNACLDDSENETVSVTAIVGIGGVGKTTLAQQIFHDELVKSHFDLEFWICVSDEFDVKRLTTEILQSSGEKTSSDSLNHLQMKLAKVVKSKRFLIVLDDLWDDSLIANGQEWQRFCAPLRSGLSGSMILVTTRSSQVAKVVCTIDLFQLEGLEDTAFWEFFKVCALDSKGCTNGSNLESIGRKIVPKLKGSPLAAKTIGHLLRMKLDADHWNSILNSELWELKQEKWDILSALRLSYVYLPQRLKRCLSLCAMFPKDFQFEQKVLVDIWLAQGFVSSQGEIPLSTVGAWYFEELKNRCFFQSVSLRARVEKFVMHDLIHDMVQLVSKGKCFVIRNEKDLLHVPENVRHLSLFTKENLDCKNLMVLSRCKKLRTILSTEELGKTKVFPLLDCWSSELKYLRFLSYSFTTLNVLPDTIAKFKLLQCLKLHIPRHCTFKTFPKSFCSLYHLEIVEAKNCHFEMFPVELSHLSNLQFFRAKTFRYEKHYTEILERYKGFTDITVLKNFNIRGKLHLRLRAVTGIGASQIELSKRNNIHWLILNFHLSEGGIIDQELLEALCPNQNIEHLELMHFKGDTIAWAGSNSVTCTFSSLTELRISYCLKVSSLQILQPAFLPAIKIISIEQCGALSSVPAEMFGGFVCLEELTVQSCKKIQWNGVILPSSLLKLYLDDCGDFLNRLPDCLLNLNNLIHLTLMKLKSVKLIPAQLWDENLLKLEQLEINSCPDLICIGGSEAIAHIENVFVESCQNLKDLRQPFQKGRRPT